MIDTIQPTKQTVDHCDSFKKTRCHGCPFVNNQCVAPMVHVNDSRWSEWMGKMNRLIAEYQESKS